MGHYGQYTALVPPGAIPRESREITVTSPDLCGLMDELDDLFDSPESVGELTPGSSWIVAAPEDERRAGLTRSAQGREMVRGCGSA